MGWNGLEWVGMVWNGLKWLEMAWNGLEWLGMAWNGLERLGMAWNGLKWLEMGYISGWLVTTFEVWCERVGVFCHRNRVGVCCPSGLAWLRQNRRLGSD